MAFPNKPDVTFERGPDGLTALVRLYLSRDINFAAQQELANQIRIAIANEVARSPEFTELVRTVALKRLVELLEDRDAAKK